MFESRSPKANRSASQSARAAERAMFAPPPFKFTHDTDHDSGTSDAAPVQAQLNPMDINFCTIPLHAPGRSSLPVQPKLTIGQPGDQYEQEADRMASQVMRMPDSPDGSQPIFQLMKAGLPVQRVMNPEEKKEIQPKPLAASITPLVQREARPEDEKESVQTKSTPEAAQANPDLESQLNATKGGGSPLSDEVRSFMEPRFGADFSQVKVHTDSRSVQMNQTLGAQAFTHGSDIYFGSGKPPAKNDLTAHELTHVVQQTGGVQAKISANQPNVQQKCSACESEDNTVRRKEDSAIPNIQRRIGDGHDLQSPRFAGDPILESVFDDEHHIKQTETGDHVAKIQQALLDLDPSCLPEHGVDGIYGSETSSAAQKFQIQNNLTPALGNIGPKTMSELDRRFQTEQEQLPESSLDRELLTNQDQSSDVETPPTTEKFPEVLPETGDLSPTNASANAKNTFIPKPPIPGSGSIQQSINEFKDKVDTKKKIDAEGEVKEPASFIITKGQNYWGFALGLDIEKTYKGILEESWFGNDRATLESDFAQLLKLCNAPEAGGDPKVTVLREKILKFLKKNRRNPSANKLITIVDPIEANRKKEVGKFVYNEFWKSYQKNKKVPNFSSHRSFAKLEALKVYEYEACFATAKNVGKHFIKQGGFSFGSRSKENEFFASVCSGIERRRLPLGAELAEKDSKEFEDGFLVNYRGLNSAISKLTRALDDGYTVHARILSGFDSACIPKTKPPEKPLPCEGCDEHSIIIIGHEGNSKFVFWDAHPPSSKGSLENGFSLLFFDGTHFSTAKDSTDLAVNFKGVHKSGQHRYQVLSMATQTDKSFN
jgi:Domain of unknown function (DUF4157)